MRGAPHSGLSMLIRRIKARSSASICGRPPRERDFHANSSEAGAMPPNDCLRLNDGKDPQDRRKPAVKLDQKQSIEVCETDPAARLTP